MNFKRNAIQSLCAVGAASLLVSCGGGSSSSLSSSAANTILTAVFFDAPVQGLSYTTLPSGQTGTTDSKGGFSYVSGDTVSFTFGTVPLGSISPGTLSGGGKAVISVLSLPNGAQTAQVLQTCNYGSTTNFNVSGLGSDANATNIQNYIQSGGTVLPAAQASSASFMRSLQAVRPPGGGHYAVLGGVATPADAVATASQGLGSIASGSIPNLVPSFTQNPLIFHIETITSAAPPGDNFAPLNTTVSGISSFGTPTGASFPVTDVSADSIQTPPVTTTSTVQATLTATTITAAHPISGNHPTGFQTVATPSYYDGSHYFFSTAYEVGLGAGATVSGETGSGFYEVLDPAFSVTSVASTIIALPTLGAGCAAGSGNFELQIGVAAGGSASFTSYCGTVAAGVNNGTGTVSNVPGMPGAIQFVDSSGNYHFVGRLPQAVGATSGTIALVEGNPTNSKSTSGLYSYSPGQ